MWSMLVTCLMLALQTSATRVPFGRHTNALWPSAAPARPSQLRSAILMKEFSQSTMLRSEVEDPFAKVRLFAFPAAFAAAGIATYFGATSAIAELANLRPASSDTYPNLAIDISALGIIGYFWRREVVAQDKRMRRIAMGAAIASLRVQLLGGKMAGKTVRLVDLRSGRGADAFDDDSRRVVVLCAEEEALSASLSKAAAKSSAVSAADLVVVPVLATADSALFDLPKPELVRGADGEASVDHLALPLGLENWGEVLSEERETAVSQDPAIMARGFTLILKKNGRVGTRRLGMPDWDSLVGDVSKRAAAGLDTVNI